MIDNSKDFSDRNQNMHDYRLPQPPYSSDCCCIIMMVKYNLRLQNQNYFCEFRIFLTTCHAPVGSSEEIVVLVVLEGASEGISSTEIAWIDPGSTAKFPIPLPPGVTALLRTDKTLLISSF